MRNQPTYAEAVQRSVVGDDPLALGTTNERLYNSAFPGFNNYVRHIRVYSALCWMAKQVALALERGIAESTVDAQQLFECAVEKIELALLWANPRAPGIAGNRREFPTHDKPIVLAFSTFGASEATLFAAVTYKPSLTGGLRFLEARSSQTYGCLPYGDALADAFDETARDLPGYRWLKAPDLLTGKRSRITELMPALDVESPSPAEQAAFLASFFPTELDESARNDDHARWLTLNLMLRAISAVCKANKAAGAEAVATVDAIRACMARGRAPNGVSVVNPEVSRVQAWWAVLQVRQLQRLCLEALYCVVERWIANQESAGGDQSIAACTQQVASAGLAYVDETLEETVAQMVDYYRGLQGDRASLYEAAAAAGQSSENDEDVFLHVAYLKDRDALAFEEDGSCPAVASAYAGLVFCAVETRNLFKNPDALQALRSDADACSLLRLADVVERNRATPVVDFMAHMIKEWVVLRHFEVVASRSAVQDGKNRFRFVLGDYGLERFDKAATLPVPALSMDKLEHALLLCKQAGLLKGTWDYRLTTAGAARVTRR